MRRSAPMSVPQRVAENVTIATVLRDRPILRFGFILEVDQAGSVFGRSLIFSAALFAADTAAPKSLSSEAMKTSSS